MFKLSMPGIKSPQLSTNQDHYSNAHAERRTWCLESAVHRLLQKEGYVDCVCTNWTQLPVLGSVIEVLFSDLEKNHSINKFRGGKTVCM